MVFSVNSDEVNIRLVLLCDVRFICTTYHYLTMRRNFVIFLAASFLFVSCSFFFSINAHWFDIKNNTVFDIYFVWDRFPSDGIITEGATSGHLVYSGGSAHLQDLGGSRWRNSMYTDSTEFFFFRADSAIIREGGIYDLSKVEKEEFLIARMMVPWDTLYYGKGARINIPPSPFSSFPIVYYNGYTPSSLTNKD